MITHEEARDIAKMNLHWGERKPMLDYISQQEQLGKLQDGSRITIMLLQEELETLKRNVYRWFELEKKPISHITDDEIKEQNMLTEKLSKVGNENE